MVLTPVNLNKSSGTTATATSRGNDSITGLSTDGQISAMRTVANSSSVMNFDDAVILGTGDAIAVEVDAASSTAIAEVWFEGFYDIRTGN